MLFMIVHKNSKDKTIKILCVKVVSVFFVVGIAIISTLKFCNQGEIANPSIPVDTSNLVPLFEELDTDEKVLDFSSIVVLFPDATDDMKSRVSFESDWLPMDGFGSYYNPVIRVSIDDEVNECCKVQALFRILEACGKSAYLVDFHDPGPTYDIILGSAREDFVKSIQKNLMSGDIWFIENVKTFYDMDFEPGYFYTDENQRLVHFW